MDILISEQHDCLGEAIFFKSFNYLQILSIFYAEQFQVFALIALLLLVLDALVLEKKKGYFKRFKFLKNYAK